MNKETKKIWLIVAGSYFAGMLITFLLTGFGCSPWCHCKKAEIMPMVSQQQMIMPHKHHGMKHPGMKQHGKHHGRPDFARHDQPTEEMRARFAEKLGLTDEQKALIEQYRSEDMAKIEPVFKQMEELQNQLRELRKAGRARFESILTDEQKEILQTMKKKHHHKRPHVFDGAAVEDKAE